MESLEDFAARVLTRTNRRLNDLPRRVATTGDAWGHIMCRRGNVLICTVGEPFLVDDEGQYWDEFEVVILT